MLGFDALGRLALGQLPESNQPAVAVSRRATSSGLPLTYRMAEALRKRRPLALIAEIDHPNGPARFWTGIGKLDWNGFTWTGSGTLGSVAPITHTTNLIIQEINFGLAGVDPAIVATLGDNVRNLSGKVWLACLGIGNTRLRKS
jgi:hypothetical protein